MKLFACLACVALVLVAGCGNPVAPVEVTQPAAARQEAEQAAQPQRLADLLAEAKKAVDEKRFEDAVSRYEEANRIQDDAPTRDLLAQARVSRDSLRLLPFDQSMQRGRDAVEATDHAAAVVAFHDALRLFPENEAATASLLSAEFNGFLEKGRTAYKGERYAEAVTALAEAAKRRPEDKETANLLADARVQRRSQAMEQGRAAMTAKQYSQAVALFTEANHLSAGADAAESLREANFQMRWERGRKSVDNKQFAAAIPDLEEATRLKPEFAEGRTLLQQARDGKKAMDMAQAMEDYKRAIAAGDAAMQRKDYTGAVDSYREAQNKQPGDLTASSKLSEAQTAKTKKDSYERHMSQAKSYMNSKNYASAESEYLAALSDSFGDSAAQNGIRDAQNGKTKKAAYERHMSAGKSYMLGNNYSAAESSFRAALSEFPGDSAASSALREAQSMSQKSLQPKPKGK
ncbi:MAG: tetratricopeptide repeat protein [Gemmataceae bacterium]